MGDADHRITIVESAVRWSRNILTEVLSNFGRVLTDQRRDALRDAVRALGSFDGLAIEDSHPDVVAARAAINRVRDRPGHTLKKRGPCQPCESSIRCLLAEETDTEESGR